MSTFSRFDAQQFVFSREPLPLTSTHPVVLTSIPSSWASLAGTFSPTPWACTWACNATARLDPL